MFRKNSKLVEHSTNVAGYSYQVFPESYQDTYQTIHLIWTLEQIVIETHSSHLGGSIKDNPDFPGLFWMVNTKVRDVPGVCIVFLVIWYKLCLTLCYDVIHEFVIMLGENGIS